MASDHYGSMEDSIGDDFTVYCRDVVKRYSDTGNPALNGAALQVSPNTIYALLGPSGCGKTTLLRCVTGRLHPKSGTIKVFGRSPSEHGQKRLGSLIGYMPQEFALHYKLTLSDTLFFFGRLFGMGTKEIRERMEFLLAFLELPEATRLVQNLSGGQQRRASLAVALLHSPPLLILDEPTVGVDPLLREKIWHYLRELVTMSHVSVIITTHYIEEARQANTVALMRSGQVLVEASPNWIMQQLAVDTLEAAFVELCRRQGLDADFLPTSTSNTGTSDQSFPTVGFSQRPANGSLKKPLLAQENGMLTHRSPINQSMDLDAADSRTALISKQPVPAGRKKCALLGISAMNIAAIAIRNLTIMSRMIGFLLFQFLLPGIQILLFCWCVGPQPHGLPLAVVNLDTGFFNYKVSTNFTGYIDPSIVTQTPYNSYEEGADAVRRGDMFGLMVFKPNYTKCLILRTRNQSAADEYTIDQSEVHLHLDFTNVQIALVFEQQIAKAFQQAMETLLIRFNMNPKQVEPLINLDTPIYGSLDATNLQYMAPGIITSIPYFLAIGLTALSFVTEAKTGILDRSLVSGVNMVEMMLALTSVQLIVMFVQIAVTMSIALGGFQLASQGSIPLVILIVVVTGLSAMGLGLMISASTSEEVGAIQLAMGIVYPNMMLSGLMWPIQAMPTWLQPIAHVLPLTFSSEAVRSVLGRGWGLDHLTVWLGLIIPIAWALVSFSLAAFIMYMRKR